MEISLFQEDAPLRVECILDPYPDLKRIYAAVGHTHPRRREAQSLVITPNPDGAKIAAST